MTHSEFETVLAGREITDAAFTGFTEDEAVSLIMHLYQSNEITARQMLAIERGEWSGCMEAVTSREGKQRSPSVR